VIRDAALEHLEEHLSESRDPDPDHREGKQAYADGSVIAYERIGLLTPSEGARWRERIADRSDDAVDPGTELGPEAKPLAERYLTGVIATVKPIRREWDQHNRDTIDACNGAIDALHAVGVLDDADHGRWCVELIHAQAPWIEDPEPPPPNALWGIGGLPPPENEQQAAEDAERRAAWERRPKATEIQRVLTGSSERHGDLAIIALVVHEDATSLYFHHLGQPEGADPRSDWFERSERAQASLRPPILTDDTGSTYEPVGRTPGCSFVAGGVPDPERREATTGRWLYTPAAPDDARTFSAQLDRRIWRLPQTR
jgi:hypothetical protein